MRGVALPILMGLGKPRRPAFALAAMGVINVVISVALIGERQLPKEETVFVISEIFRMSGEREGNERVVS